MATNIGKGFAYNGTEADFARSMYATVVDMYKVKDANLPAVYDAVVVSNGKRYRYIKTNTKVSISTSTPENELAKLKAIGRWRMLEDTSGGGLTADEMTSVLNSGDDGAIYQYVGETNDSYVHGAFYEISVPKTTSYYAFSGVSGETTTAVNTDKSIVAIDALVSSAGEIAELYQYNTSTKTWDVIPGIKGVPKYDADGVLCIDIVETTGGTTTCTVYYDKANDTVTAGTDRSWKMISAAGTTAQPKTVAAMAAILPISADGDVVLYIGPSTDDYEYGSYYKADIERILVKKATTDTPAEYVYKSGEWELTIPTVRQYDDDDMEDDTKMIVGKVVQYIGDDEESGYAKGSMYECIEDESEPPVKSWKKVSGGGAEGNFVEQFTATDFADDTKKTLGKIVQSVTDTGYHKSAMYECVAGETEGSLVWKYVDDTKKDALIGSADEVGKTRIYSGPTNTQYENGIAYTCQSHTETVTTTTETWAFADVANVVTFASGNIDITPLTGTTSLVEPKATAEAATGATLYDMASKAATAEESTAINAAFAAITTLTRPDGNVDGRVVVLSGEGYEPLTGYVTKQIRKTVTNTYEEVSTASAITTIKYAVVWLDNAGVAEKYPLLVGYDAEGAYVDTYVFEVNS